MLASNLMQYCGFHKYFMKPMTVSLILQSELRPAEMAQQVELPAAQTGQPDPPWNLKLTLKLVF